MRALVQRDDADFAVPFIFDHRVDRALNDVHITVVSSRQDGWSAKRKAPDTEREILRSVGTHRPLDLHVFVSSRNRLRRCSYLLSLRRERRNVAIWRIDNQ